MRHTSRALILVGLLLSASSVLHSQNQVASVAASTSYQAGFLRRFIMGSNWRDVWAIPVSVPVLDLSTFAGGLVPNKAGGNQSKTLRLKGADGKTYMFRSTDKFINRSLPDDVKDTPAATLITDQASAFHPTGSMAAYAMQARLNFLFAQPQMVVMPDDARLGEWRAGYAGLLGQIEERPEGDDDKGKGFGANGVPDSKEFMAALESSLDHVLDSREYLAVRLLDFLIGDTDRGGDQWRWAEFPEDGRSLYRPVPRDRDYAFMNGGGISGAVVRKVFPKYAKYSGNFSSLTAMTQMTVEFDRSHLVNLSWAAWDSTIARITSALDDLTIEDAFRRLPQEEQALSRDVIVAGLKGRRATLRDYAQRLFVVVNTQADVFGSNEADLADIERHADGSVVVKLYSERVAKLPPGSDRMAAFERRFVPSETREIRIYMQEGADRVLVHGSAANSITVRVTGGAGDDNLIDSSRVENGGHITVFYDSHGKNTFVPGPNTRVVESEFIAAVQPKVKKDDSTGKPIGKLPEVLEERRGHFEDLIDRGDSWVEQRTMRGAARTWGTKSGLSPIIKTGQGVGIIVGLGRSHVRYAFRHEPYQSKFNLDAAYGTGSGGFSVEARGDLRRENSPLGLNLSAGFTQLKTNRFFGYGNDTDTTIVANPIVFRDELAVKAAIRVGRGIGTWIAVGPMFRSVSLKPEPGSPAAATFGTPERFSQAGMEFEALLDARDDGANPHKGFLLQGSAAAFPAMLDLTQSYATTRLQARGYLPLWKATLAFRVGGDNVFSDGPVPLQDAAFIGGSHKLRGHVRDRFAGDMGAYGTAELRIPLVRVALFTRGTLGVFGFADAGRVWVDGASPSGWHKGYGGGLSFASLGGAVTVGYGMGEQKKIYLDYGFPF